MAPFTNLSRFLQANGVGRAMAEQATSTLEGKVNANRKLNDSEVTLVSEFLARVNVPKSAQLIKLSRMLDQRSTRLRSSNLIADKSSAGPARLLADKTSGPARLLADKSSAGPARFREAKGAGTGRSQDRSVLPPPVIRQLAASIARS